MVNPWRELSATGSVSPTVAARMDALPISCRHRRATAVIGLGLFFEIYEVFLAGVLSTVLIDHFQLGKTETLLLLASGFFGMFLGALMFGQLADRFGRRFGFLLSLGVYSVFSLIGAFSVGPAMLVVSRFLAGLGIGAAPPIADCYLADLLPRTQRGRYTAWAYTLCFCGVPMAGLLGRWLVPAAPLGWEGWRWMFAIGALGAVTVFALRSALPESPRWLESVGRVDEARATADWFAQRAGVDRRAKTSTPVRVSTERDSWRRLLVAPYRRRSVMMAIFHLFQTWGYYGFGTLVPMVLSARGYSIVESLLFSAVTFTGYPVGSALSVAIVERCERKYLVVASALGMAALGVAFGIAPGTGWVLVFGFGYTLVSNVFSNAFHIYQAEIFPTPLRATAVSGAYSISRLSSGAMPFVLVPLLHDYGAGILFATIAAALTVVTVDVALLGPRTTGRALDRV